MSTTPQFAGTTHRESVVISTANTARDGTGTIGTVFTAGSSGSRISRVIVKAQGTTTAGMVRLFIHDGTSAHIIREISVSALTPSATVQSFSSVLSEMVDTDIMPLILDSGESLRASTHNAEAFVVTAIGGDF